MNLVKEYENKPKYKDLIKYYKTLDKNQLLELLINHTIQIEMFIQEQKKYKKGE